MANVFAIVQLLVAPVVMISAGGLLCLAWYNRLAAIVSRARAFHRERLELRDELAALEGEAGRARAAELNQRMHTVDEQSQQVLRRARLMRDALTYELLSVLCMLLCSLAMGVSLWSPAWAVAAVAMFALGGVLMAAAVVLAVLELRTALDPVTLEYVAVAQL